MKKMYVTYHWLEMYGNRSNTKAIECANNEQLCEVASDVVSLHGIRNVRINFCGKLPKGTDIINYEQYKSGEYYNA
jgi:hypothetical protein